MSVPVYAAALVGAPRSSDGAKCLRRLVNAIVGAGGSIQGRARLAKNLFVPQPPTSVIERLKVTRFF